MKQRVSLCEVVTSNEAHFSPHFTLFHPFSDHILPFHWVKGVTGVKQGERGEWGERGEKCASLAKTLTDPSENVLLECYHSLTQSVEGPFPANWNV